MNHLDRAREKIEKARETAPGGIHRQLGAIRRGIFQEEGGNTTQDAGGPKIERVSEVANKLDGLDQEIDDPETREYVEEALEHVYTYMDEHPHGGLPPDSEEHTQVDETLAEQQRDPDESGDSEGL